MQQVLDALAVDEEDSSIIEHFGQVGDVIFFHPFAGIG
jgi:hypothetical protein